MDTQTFPSGYWHPNPYAPSQHSGFNVFSQFPLPQGISALNSSSFLPAKASDKNSAVQISASPAPASPKPPATKVTKSSGSNAKPSSAGSNITEVKIENAFLAYLRSEMLRMDRRTVITNVIEKFGYDEMLAARKVLFLNTGTKPTGYRYAGLNDPATPHQRMYHCTANIVAKLDELSHSDSKYSVSFLCNSDDLFRLFAIANRSSESSDIEDRLAKVERELSSAKVQIPTHSEWPVVGSVNSQNRVDFLKHMNQNRTDLTGSPSKKRRLDEDTSGPGKSNWSSVQHKRNGVKPNNSESQLRGKPPKKSASGGRVLPEVFLFNYSEDATPEVVLNHFKSRGVRAVHVRYRCHEKSESKRFVMKIQSPEDFDSVVTSLPTYTGCRWYDPDNRPDPSSRPRGFFNTGNYITGPGVRLPVSHEVFQLERDLPGTPNPSRAESLDVYHTPVQNVGASAAVTSSNPTTDGNNVPPVTSTASSPMVTGASSDSAGCINTVASTESSTVLTKSLADYSVTSLINPKKVQDVEIVSNH